MGPISSPETSVINQPTLRSNNEDGRTQDLTPKDQAVQEDGTNK